MANPAAAAVEVRAGRGESLPAWADDVIVAKALGWVIWPWQVRYMPAAWLARISAVFDAEAAAQRAQQERDKAAASGGSRRSRRSRR